MMKSEPEVFWEDLGECAPPEHLVVLKQKNYRWVLLRCKKCGVLRKRKRHLHDPKQPCRCVNLEIQRRKMGAWMKWATGDKMF